MKRILSFILIIAVIANISSCKKKELAGISSYEQLGIGAYVTLSKTTNLIIDYANLSTTTVSITVKEYGKPLDKIKIYVTPGAATANRSTWKLVKEVAYPTPNTDVVLNVKATEIAAALGIPPTSLVTGQSYTLYNQLITKDGGVWDLSNTLGEFSGNPNYNMALTWTTVVVCPYLPASIGGVGNTVKFKVLQDDWADYSPGDLVDVTIGAAGVTFPMMWLTAPARPVVVAVAAATGAVTVADQNYGDYLNYGITNIFCKSSGTNNWLFSCTGTITLTLNHHVGTTNYGTYLFRLIKV